VGVFAGILGTLVRSGAFGRTTAQHLIGKADGRRETGHRPSQSVGGRFLQQAAPDFHPARRADQLPADEQAQMLRTLKEVGAEVAKRKPRLQQAYQVFAAVAKRTR
jgi:hypothetical protein